jgi:hypothetical protein
MKKQVEAWIGFAERIKYIGVNIYENSNRYG